VLAVIYLIYTAGQTRQAEPDLCREAIRLARILATLMPDEPEAAGLLALPRGRHSRVARRPGPQRLGPSG
jgi:RNA polymerase sigma-70 factor (ECF subfamily)